MLSLLCVFGSIVLVHGSSGGGQSVATGSYAPFQLPLGGKPLQVPSGTNPFLPVYPATHMFGSEFEWNTGHNKGVGVDFRFPILDRKAGLKYPWDFEFNYREQQEHPGYKYGHIVHPQPKGKGLQIPFDQIMVCLYLPEACSKSGGGSRGSAILPHNDQPVIMDYVQTGHGAEIHKSFLRQKVLKSRFSR